MVKETVIKEHGKATSEIDIFPRAGFVIVKMMYNISVLNLTNINNKNAKQNINDTEVSFFVAGIADDTQTLKIGDRIIVAEQPIIELKVPTNHNTLKAQLDFFESFSPEQRMDEVIKGTTATIIEYGLFRDFDIIAINNYTSPVHSAPVQS